MNRAYSLLEVKAIDEDKREITGIATTPSTDRLGDIVEPKGAEFRLPIPLLWQHRSDQPIGQVTAARVTSEGIEVRASFAKLDEPGKLKDRLDEAWQSVKAGLVRGLSIGFQSIESARIDGTYGIRFIKWLWLELSAVTIPANADASIQTIKAIDDEALAATGRTRRAVSRLSSPAGATASTPRPLEGKAMKTSEQITAFEAKRLASSDRMEAIMQKAADEGRTLDQSETEEYDTLTAEVKAVDEHLVRLRALEKAQAVKARPVDQTPASSASRDPVITVRDTLPKGMEFARYVRCLVLARGNLMQANEIAKANFPDNARIHNVLKAAVAGGTSLDSTWAAPLVDYQTLASEFIEFLRPMTILGKFGTGNVPSLRRIPFNVRMPRQTTGGAGYWVGEGAPKPLTKFDFDEVTLRWAKVANIAVLTDELVRFSNPSADAIVQQALADALRERLDIDFVDPDKAVSANVSPASITNGVVAVSTAGPTAANARTDVQNLMAAFLANNIMPSVWIMSTQNALALSLMQNALGQPEFPGLTMNGGTYAGLPVITSEYLTNVADSSGSPLILAAANEIFLADDGGITIDASREASLQMDDSPTNNSSTGTGTSLVSMFQTNSIAIRAERIINWTKRRAAAVAFINDASYTA